METHRNWSGKRYEYSRHSNCVDLTQHTSYYLLRSLSGPELGVALENGKAVSRSSTESKRRRDGPWFGLSHKAFTRKLPECVVTSESEQRESRLERDSRLPQSPRETRQCEVRAYTLILSAIKTRYWEIGVQSRPRQHRSRTEIRTSTLKSEMVTQICHEPLDHPSMHVWH